MGRRKKRHSSWYHMQTISNKPQLVHSLQSRETEAKKGIQVLYWSYKSPPTLTDRKGVFFVRRYRDMRRSCSVLRTSSQPPSSSLASPIEQGEHQETESFLISDHHVLTVVCSHIGRRAACRLHDDGIAVHGLNADSPGGRRSRRIGAGVSNAY